MIARRFNLLFLGHMCLECLGSLTGEPDVKALFSGIYSSLSLTSKGFSDPEARPTDYLMLSEDDNIQHITEELQKSQHLANESRLTRLIVDDLCMFSELGRMDLGNTWEKYMADYLTVPVNLPSKGKVTNFSWKLHRWCSELAQETLQNERPGQDRNQAFMRELGYIFPTKESVRLAVDFHRFVMVWGMSALMDKMAITFVLIVFDTIIVRDVMEKLRSCYMKHELDEYDPLLQRLFAQSLYHKREPKPKIFEDFVKVFKQIVSVQWPIHILHTHHFMTHVALLSSAAVIVKQDIPLVFSSAYAFGRSTVVQHLKLDFNQLPLDEVEKRLDEFWEGHPVEAKERIHEFRAARNLYQEFYEISCIDRDLYSAFGLYKVIASAYYNKREPSLQSARVLVGHMTEFEHMLAEGAKVNELVPSRRATPWDMKEIAVVLSNLLSPPSPPGFENIWSWIIPKISLYKLPTIVLTKIIELKHRWEESLKKFQEAQLSRQLQFFERLTNCETSPKLGKTIAKNGKNSARNHETSAKELEALAHSFETIGKADTARTDDTGEISEKGDKIFKQALADFVQNPFHHSMNDSEVEDKYSTYKIITKNLEDLFIFYETSILKLRWILEERWNQYLNTPISHCLYYTMTRLENDVLLNALEALDKKTQNNKDCPTIKFQKLGNSLKQMASNPKISYNTWKKDILPTIYAIPNDWAEWWNEIFQDSVNKPLHDKLKEFISNRNKSDRNQSQKKSFIEGHSDTEDSVIREKAGPILSRTENFHAIELKVPSSTNEILDEIKKQVDKRAQLLIKLKKRLDYKGYELHQFNPDDTLDVMIEKDVGNMAVLLEQKTSEIENERKPVGALLL